MRGRQTQVTSEPPEKIETQLTSARRASARASLVAPPGTTCMRTIQYCPPAGAFYAFVAIDGLRDSADLAKRLVTRHGVAVAPGIAFGDAGEGWLRICFAQSTAFMERAMQRLRDGIRVEMGL